MKYRQRGYRDDADRGEERPAEPRRERDGPSGRLADPQRHLRSLRCHHCGRTVPLQLDAGGDVRPTASDVRCGSCAEPVHCCSNCVHFDTDAAFECRKSVRLTQAKAAANDCAEFEPRLSVEITRDEGRPDDGFARPKDERRRISAGRRAFDDLFK